MNTSREQLLDLIVRWEEAKAQGQSPELEALCQSCPDRLEELREHLERLGHAAWLDDLLTESSALASKFEGPLAVPINLPQLMAGRYRLDALIGAGGFAWVYRGFDTWLERPIAVKIPKVNRLIDGEEIDQCRLEAKKVARLRHPHIVPVYDVGRDGSSCFIVSEWIEGQNLEALLKSKNRRLETHEATRIAIEVAEALGCAHREGYVHRDVKPANILLDLVGKAYLTDFGIATLEAELTEDEKAAGTLPYMAPELLDPSRTADHRADLYALGVVLYEMLSGHRPFEASSRAILRERILAGNPPPVASGEVPLPEPLQRVCLRAIAADPSARYQSAEEIIAELRAI